MREIKRRRLKLIPLADKETIEKYTMMSIHTLRNWRSRKKYPEFFVAIGRKVFLDARAWDRHVLRSKRESIKEAKRMREILG